MTEEVTKKGLGAAVRSRFVIRVTSSPSQDALRAAIEASRAPYRDVGESLFSAVAAALSTLRIPATLAAASVYEMEVRFGVVLERIDALRRADDESAQRNSDGAHAQVQRKLEEQVKGDLGDKLAERAASFLLAADQEDQFRTARIELLRQGVVLIWGAVEAFARQLVVRYLDAHPIVALDLMASPEGRRLLGVRALDFELLRDMGFDLSGRMGQVVARFHDLSSLQALRTVASILFPDDEVLRNALGSKELWILAQRRHVIVHHRGVVDERYVAATGDTSAPGQPLVVSPEEIGQYVAAVQMTGAAFLSAVERMGGGA